MLKVHHSPFTRSVRVRWLLEELAVPYELVPVEFSPAALLAPAHLAVHPLGQVPAIEDGALALFESGAILQHIMERHGDGGLLPPAGSDDRSRCWQWFHYGEATLGRALSDITRNQRKPEAERIPSVLADARKRFSEAISVLENALGDAPYVLGDRFSVADIMCGYVPILARVLKELNEEQHPRAVAYGRRLRERPACRKALE